MKPRTKRRDGLQLRRFPSYRRFAAAAYWSVRHKPTIHGLLEVDVTGPRALLREHRDRTGESISFTAFLVACLARAVDEHKEVQAFRAGARHLAVFDDVDVAARVEHEIAGEKCVVVHVLRRAQQKTVGELHDEIRAAQAREVRPALATLGYVPPALHRTIVRAFTAAGARSPRLWKRLMGTVGITSVGMFGGGAGWGIPAASPTALMVTVGGIGRSRPSSTAVSSRAST